MQLNQEQQATTYDNRLAYAGANPATGTITSQSDSMKIFFSWRFYALVALFIMGCTGFFLALVNQSESTASAPVGLIPSLIMFVAGFGGFYWCMLRWSDRENL